MGNPTAPRRAQLARDLLLVAAVPLALGAVHLGVPPAVQERFVLAPDAPTATTLFTAAFLHVSDAHLLGNVVGYLLSALSAYLLCLRLGERQWFHLSTGALVLGVPVLVNWASVGALSVLFGPVSVPIRGFSGVSAAFGGFAFAGLLALVGRATDRWTTLFAGLAVSLLLLWEVLVIYAGGVPVRGTALAALGIALSLAMVARRTYPRGLPAAGVDRRRAAWLWLLAGWTVLVLAVLVTGLFPAEIVEDGRVTNVFAHAIGFGLGFVVSGWGYRYWRTTYP